MPTYNYATDSESGTLDAANWDEARAALDAMVTEAAIADGGWGWIEDTDGDRYTIGNR